MLILTLSILLVTLTAAFTFRGGTSNLDDLRYYRHGALALAEKKCVRLSYPVKARDVAPWNWKKRAKEARRDWIDLMYAGYHCPNTWLKAVEWAQGPYPGTSSWLLSCSASEGGHGRWFPNRQGSGASGWMQFMRSTWEGFAPAAVQTARRRGYYVKAEWVSWYHPAGQALTAASMFERGLTRHWVGSGC